VIAQKALGAENVTGVSMPSPYTSQMSREDARTLAQNLGIRFLEIPINDISTPTPGAGRGLQKASSRMKQRKTFRRGSAHYLMALSNKFGSILLSTGNKSETAVGYCTIYGDMNGGLAVISDLPKTLVYRLAQRINRERETIPARVISRPPSASSGPTRRPGQPSPL